MVGQGKRRRRKAQQPGRLFGSQCFAGGDVPIEHPDPCPAGDQGQPFLAGSQGLLGVALFGQVIDREINQAFAARSLHHRPE